MPRRVLEEFQEPAGRLEVLGLHRLLILLVDLLGGGQLVEVVAAPEVLIVYPDVPESHSYSPLVKRGDLLVDITLGGRGAATPEAELGLKGREMPSLDAIRTYHV